MLTLIRYYLPNINSTTPFVRNEFITAQLESIFTSENKIAVKNQYPKNLKNKTSLFSDEKLLHEGSYLPSFFFKFVIEINIKNLLKFYFTIISLFCYFKTFSQQHNIIFSNFLQKDGLSQNSIYAISQTTDGYFWLGTLNGLNKFDGKNNQVFVFPSTKNEGSNQITSILVDKAQNIWVGTSKNIWLFNKFKNEFIKPNQKFLNLSLPDDVEILSIIEDNKNNICISTNFNGLYIYSKNNKTLNNINKQFFDGQIIRNMVIDTFNNLWCCGETNVYKINVESKIVKRILPQNNKVLLRGIEFLNNKIWVGCISTGLLLIDDLNNKKVKSNYLNNLSSISAVRVIKSKTDSTLWIGSMSNGVFELNIKNLEVTKLLKEYFTDYSLKSGYILSLHKLLNGEMAVGSSTGGIYLSKTANDKILLYKNEQIDKINDPDNILFSTYITKEKIIGGTLIKGLWEYNFATKKYCYRTPKKSEIESVGGKNMYNMVKIKKSLWIASFAGLAEFKNNQFIYHKNGANQKENNFWCLEKISENKLILGSDAGLFYYHINENKFEQLNATTSKTLSSNKHFIARHISIIDTTSIYISTNNENLLLLNLRLNTISNHPQFNKVSSIARHSNIIGNYLWIATDNGLIQAEKKSKALIKVWTYKDGLYKDNVCYSVLGTGLDDYVWVGTNGGIARVDINKQEVLMLGIEDGLQDYEFNTASCTYDGKYFYFGGIHGLNAIEPSLKFDESIPLTPRIFKLKVLNESEIISDTIVSYVTYLKLKPKQNNFNLFVSSPGVYSNEVKYEYKLDALSNDWIEIADNNEINFTNIPPGMHTLILKATNKKNKTSISTNNISIEILAPWWKTNAFIFSLFTLFATLLYLLYRFRINLINKKAENEMQLLKSELNLRLSQMNPHFIFNCLNSIKELVIDSHTIEANKYITKFAALMRQTLHFSIANSVTLTEAIKYFQNYVEMEKLRTGDFSFSIKVDEELFTQNVSLQPMLIQPLLENAIWHGITKSKHEKEIKLSFLHQPSKNGFLISIIDTGPGGFFVSSLLQNYSPNISTDRSNVLSNKKSIAIQNILERIELMNTLNEQKITLEIFDNNIEDISKKGTTVLFFIPYSTLKKQ